MYHKKKDKVSFEIRNAREWDPAYAGHYFSSSEDESENDEHSKRVSPIRSDNDSTASLIPFHPFARQAQLTPEKDNGFQLVSRRDTGSVKEVGLLSDQIKEIRARPPRALAIINRNTDIKQSPPRQHNRDKSLDGYAQSPRSRDNIKEIQHPNPPDSEYLLHKDPVDIATGRVIARNLAEIGLQHKSIIRAPKDGRDRKIFIWGNPKQVTKTKAGIKSWLRYLEDRPSRSEPIGKILFAHEPSSRGPAYKQAATNEERALLLKRLQQLPDPDLMPRYSGQCAWPINDFNPFDIFGTNLQALDYIREKFGCHITFDDRREVFCIQSDDFDAIEYIKERVGSALRSTQTQGQFDMAQYHVHLDEEMAGDFVRLQDVTNAAGAVNKYAFLEDGLVSHMGLDIEAHARQSREKIDEMLQDTLPGLIYCSGDLRMQIDFGNFHFTRIKVSPGKQGLPLQSFIGIVELEGTKGKLVSDANLRLQPSQFAAQIVKASHLLSPMDPSADDLRDVMASIFGTFHIDRLDKSPLRYENEYVFSTMRNGSCDEMVKKWYKNAEQREIERPLDIHMIRIHNGCSWNLHIRKHRQVDAAQIDDKMKRFMDSIRLVKMQDMHILHQNTRLMNWQSGAGNLQPSRFEQRIVYRYHLLTLPSWILEFRHCEIFIANAMAPCESHWEASLSNVNWQRLLAENVGISIGETARWAPDIKSFFPDENGVREIFEAARQAHEILNLLHDP